MRAVKRVTAPMADARRLLWGQSASFVGDEVTTFLLPTIAVVNLHASTFVVSSLLGASMVGYPLFGLVAGVVCDRVRRRRVMILADVVRLVALASIPLAATLHHLNLAQLFAVAVISSSAGVFFGVAYQAFLPGIVPGDELERANAWFETSRANARLSGPAVAGLLAQWIGPARAVLADALSFVASVAGLAAVGTREAKPAPRQGASPRSEFTTGLSFVRRDPVLRSLTIVMTMGMASGAIVRGVLFTFAYRALHLSPGQLGTVLALGGVAGLLGALACRPLTARFGSGRLLCWAPVLEGLSWLLAPLALLGAPLLFLGLAVVGSSVVDPIWNVNSLTIRQRLVPTHLQGRVHAAVRTVSWLGFPVGALIGGAVASVLGGLMTERLALALTLALGAVTVLHTFVYIDAGDIEAAKRRPADVRPPEREEQPCPST